MKRTNNPINELTAMLAEDKKAKKKKPLLEGYLSEEDFDPSMGPNPSLQGGDDNGDDFPLQGMEGGEGDAPTAKKCGKKKAKTRRCAEGEEEICPDCGKPCSECECGDDDDDDDGCEGDDCDDDDSDDTPDETTVEDIFDSICEENGVEVPAEEPGEGDDDGEGDDEGDDDTGEGAPSAKCSKGGKKKKAKKPMKKRRSEGGENITTGTDNDADKNSHLRKVPSNRFW